VATKLVAVITRFALNKADIVKLVRIMHSEVFIN